MIDGEECARLIQNPIDSQRDLIGAIVELHFGDHTVAFSGGSDSLVLATAFGRHARYITLTTERGGADRRNAAMANLPTRELIVTERELFAVIERHRTLLGSLADYTQRMLAIGEIMLCEFAKDRLVTGHGPEAILGGFRRHPMPDLSHPDKIVASLFRNVDRLRAVSQATGCEIALPFLEPEPFSILVRMRRNGMTRPALLEARGIPVPETKSALQNGSGLHRLVSDLARTNGFAYRRDYLSSIISP